MHSTLVHILSLRTRRLSRFAAAAFALLYAAFASGAAFGPLDLMGLPPVPSVDCAKRCCGCGAEMHASGKCCCTGHDHEGAARPPAGISWFEAAKCSGPTETLAGEMTRVLPHVDLEAAESLALVPSIAPNALDLTLHSIPATPPEKVPLAL